MKLTPKAKTVLAAIAKLPNGCGCRWIAEAMGLHCGKTKFRVAGAYAARLAREGWITKQDEWFPNSRGGETWGGVICQITEKGKAAIQS